MFRRIDLFRPVAGKLDVLHHFTEKMAEALQAIGVRTRILIAEYGNPEPFITDLMNDLPNCTLSFNGLLPDDKGRFFCDMMKIPHVAYLIDSPIDYTIMTTSHYNIIGSPDKYSTDFLRGLNFQNIMQLGHGVEKNLATSREPRIYDVAMFSPLIDYETIAEGWEKQFGKDVAEAMHAGCEKVLNQKDLSAVYALVQEIDTLAKRASSFHPETLNCTAILSQMQAYIKGRDRIDLLHSFKTTHVHIFGQAAETATWDKYILPEQKNIHIHKPLHFSEVIERMRESRIVLSSNAWMKSGVHFMTLYGLMAGALVLTHENSYMHEFFIDRDSIAYYNHSYLETVEESVQRYLHDESLRWEVALHGREEVLRRHTWDHRARSLVQQLDALLFQILSE